MLEGVRVAVHEAWQQDLLGEREGLGHVIFFLVVDDAVRSVVYEDRDVLP